MNEETNKKIIKEFEEYGFEIPNIPINRNYWIVRAKNLNYNLSPYFINPTEIWYDGKEHIYSYDEHEILTNYSRQNIENFNLLSNIKKGDVVLFPNSKFEKIKFFEVESEETDTPNSSEFFYYKNPTSNFKSTTRKLRLLKELEVNELHFKLISKFDLQSLTTIQKNYGIFNIDNYADYIDGALFDIYIKGNKTVYSFKVTEHNQMKAEDLRTLVNLPWMVNECIENNFYNLSDIETQIHINSPGYYRIISHGINGARFIANLTPLALFFVHGFTIDTSVIGGLVITNQIDKRMRKHDKDLKSARKLGQTIKCPNPKKGKKKKKK